MPNQRFVGKTPMGARGDAIVELDWSVGKVLDTLDRLKLSNDTLFIFTSDNGPVVDDGYQDRSPELLGDHKPAGPYRGGKYSAYDGGTRVPFIAQWPGRIKPGTSNALLSQVDLLSSLASFSGQKLPADAAPDSFDVMPALLGESEDGPRPPGGTCRRPVPDRRRLESHPGEPAAASAMRPATSWATTRSPSCLTWRRIPGSRRTWPRSIPTK